MKHFITPDELAAKQQNTVILDVRGPEAYAKGHIEGAFVMSLDGDLSGPVAEHGGRHPLPDMAVFAKKLESFGITKESHIVICDSWIFLAGRLWWMLRYIGLENIQVLNGGIERWVKEGHPITTEPTVLPEKASFLDYRLQPHMFMGRAEVLAASEAGDHVIIDARAGARYEGSVIDTFDGMTGHIPGAVNYFWENCYTADGVKLVEELKEMFKDLFTTKKPIVAYCGSGITACLTMLAMYEVGIDAALYVGSSSDWVTYDNFPIKTGCEFIAG
ncbi:MAG: sulfurtransferase [Veillonella sp.]|uniref:sulfurtransferase n=1 Tax=Veillonella sp. TaxID=1926307 RepID=UPI0025CDB6D7|nr:sulfurtransferase [Veillonella sp.]MBS4913220.1 sulfurtransferase [Veillonella sp.]